MRIALFGGSFNPVHYSHIDIAESVLRENLSDELWFIPCSNHAFGKELASINDRVEMIKFAVGNNKKIKISDIESSRSGISYTSDTIKILMKKFPNNIFFWVMGSDNLKDIIKWHDFYWLRENVNFILFNRPGYVGYSDCGIKIVSRLDDNRGISSTDIRNSIKLNKPITELVDKKVKDYIINSGLYK